MLARFDDQSLCSATKLVNPQHAPELLPLLETLLPKLSLDVQASLEVNTPTGQYKAKQLVLISAPGAVETIGFLRCFVQARFQMASEHLSLAVVQSCTAAGLGLWSVTDCISICPCHCLVYSLPYFLHGGRIRPLFPHLPPEVARHP